MSILSLQSLLKSFGGLVAVAGVTFDVEENAIVGLIGPNGAGKTTVFNLITGNYRPDSGDIIFNGRKITGLPTHRIVTMGIARTFQNIRLFHNMSVIENVLVGAHTQLKNSTAVGAVFHTRTYKKVEAEARNEARRLLRFVGLPAGAGDRIAKNLPYGQQRHLEIARALATNPTLLLLDEPAAGLNPQEKIQLAELIDQLRSEYDLAVLLIEHDMGLIMNISDRILAMEYGKPLITGTPEEVRTDPKVIKAYLGE